MAVALLAFAVTHEFGWLYWPAELQGDVRSVTQWPLVACLCALLALVARSRDVTAACVAVAVMSSTTAACSAVWIYAPWPVQPGQEQCSAHWGVPVLLVSVLAACLVLWRWPRG